MKGPTDVYVIAGIVIMNALLLMSVAIMAHLFGLF